MQKTDTLFPIDCSPEDRFVLVMYQDEVLRDSIHHNYIMVCIRAGLSAKARLDKLVYNFTDNSELIHGIIPVRDPNHALFHLKEENTCRH